MRMIYKGKTKDVYDNGDGNFLLQFKDDVTGTDGKFDPGANTVGLTIEGVSKSCVRLTAFFFKKIEDAGIPTQPDPSRLDRRATCLRPLKERLSQSAQARPNCYRGKTVLQAKVALPLCFCFAQSGAGQKPLCLFRFRRCRRTTARLLL